MRDFVYVTRKTDGAKFCVSMADYVDNPDVFDLVEPEAPKEVIEKPKKTIRKKAAPKE